MKQVIIFDLASGEIRRVIDPNGDPFDYEKDHGALSAEGVLLYEKRGGGQDHLHSWKAALAAHLSKKR